MLYFKFSLAFLWAVFSLSTCSKDDGMDPEDSCEFNSPEVDIELDGATATATASDGNPPYEYVWNNDTEGPTLIIEGPGNYSVTVTDSNGCTGSKELVVQGISNLVGIWEMTAFAGGIPVGSYQNIYDENCTNILEQKVSSSGYFEFAPGNTFFYSWTEHTILTNIAFDSETCVINEDFPDTDYYSTEEGNGTYYFNGTNYILTYDGGNTETVIDAGQGYIQIYEELYQRQ